MNDLFCSLALQYNFNSIKNYALDGGDLNICGSDGRSLLTCFIDGYMNFGDPYTKAENDLFQEYMDDDSFWNAFLPEVAKLPLHKRSSGIREQLDFLIDHGCDPNLCEMIDGETETALMLAVCDRDYYLAEYLLGKGANPGLWLLEDNKNKYDKEYWLLDELDIGFEDGCHGERAEASLGIAELLYSAGLTDWQGKFICFDNNGHASLR